MKCPVCNGNTELKDIVHAPDNEDYRRRKCKDCGRIFHTIEYEVTYDEQFADLWNKNHRIKNKKGKL